MRYVKYIGPSHQRLITARDWATVGIQAETVAWGSFNGFAVSLDSLSEDQVTKAIDPDPFFVITSDDEDFTPVPQSMDMTPGQYTQATENPVDVVGALDAGVMPSEAISGANEAAPGGDAPTTVTTGTGSGHDEPA